MKGVIFTEFIKIVEDYIHVEVLKLYPDAELLKFNCQRDNAHQLTMIYHSSLCLGHFSEGLMTGCVNHYEESIDIQMDLQNEDWSVVKFILTQQKNI
jgi:hypothetical protein